MASIIEEVKRKIKDIEQLQRDKAKQEGQKEQLLKQLKDESGTVSIDKAEKKLEELSLELIEHEKLLKNLDTEMGEIILAATPKEKQSDKDDRLSGSQER